MKGLPRVLLVDDDKKLVPLLARGLRYEGFEVQAATTGEEGLALARAQAPDVVVLDIGMPDLDGFEVCRRLRKHLDVPIIMLTARDEVEDKVKALGLGADDIVTVPPILSPWRADGRGAHVDQSRPAASTVRSSGRQDCLSTDAASTQRCWAR